MSISFAASNVPVADPAVAAAIGKLKDVIADVNTIVIERDEPVNALALAIVAERHAFIAGLPGTAKSMALGEILARIEGARTGFFTLTKGSTPESLVGPLSLKALEEQDVLRHNTAGMLPDVHFAYITEVFKGNALTRNAVLQVLNEGVFLNGGKIERCPLKMCAADSNEYPDAREDAAFWDRFLVRVQVEPITDFSKRMRMVRQSLKRGRRFAEAAPMISLDEIALLNQARTEVGVPEEVDEAALGLLNALHADGIKIGDRRFAETFHVAAARALLAGRMSLIPDDLQVFSLTAWSNPDERKEVRQAVLKAVAPELAELTKLYDEIEDAFEAFLEKKKEADESGNRKLAMAANQEFGDPAENAHQEMGKKILIMQRQGKDVAQALEMRQKVKSRIEQALKLTMRRNATEDEDLLAS